MRLLIAAKEKDASERAGALAEEKVMSEAALAALILMRDPPGAQKATITEVNKAE